VPRWIYGTLNSRMSSAATRASVHRQSFIPPVDGRVGVQGGVAVPADPHSACSRSAPPFDASAASPPARPLGTPPMVHRFGAHPQQPGDLPGIHVLHEHLCMDLQERQSHRRAERDQADKDPRPSISVIRLLRCQVR
jgi:hypothetical protein